MPTIEDHLKDMPEFEGYNGSIRVGVNKAISNNGIEAINLEICRTAEVDFGMMPGIGRVSAVEVNGFNVILSPQTMRALIEALTDMLESIPFESVEVAGTRIEV